MKRRGCQERDFSNFIMKGGLKCLKRIVSKSLQRKLRRSLISQLESQKTNIEPFLDNVDRYISLWKRRYHWKKIYPRTALDWRMVKE